MYLMDFYLPIDNELFHMGRNRHKTLEISLSIERVINHMGRSSLKIYTESFWMKDFLESIKREPALSKIFIL